MQSARNLKVYERAFALARTVYAVTADFPREEKFGLTSQIRRAAVSIGSNIAEGCGRRGDRELVNYLHIALGSASELEFQLELASSLGMAREAELEATITQTVASKACCPASSSP